MRACVCVCVCVRVCVCVCVCVGVCVRAHATQGKRGREGGRQREEGQWDLFAYDVCVCVRARASMCVSVRVWVRAGGGGISIFKMGGGGAWGGRGL